jgi:hypothetical protein
MAAPPNGPVVRLNADKPAARLQMMRLRWTDVCVSPCGVAVDPSGTYRVGGGSIRPSEEFRMPRPAGTVLVQAEVGSTVKHWVGIGMLAGGAGLALGGLLYYATASSTTTNAFGDTVSSDTYKAVGITYMVIGVIVAAIGIPLAMSSTSVEVH